jgi:DNA repair protein RadC
MFDTEGGPPRRVRDLFPPECLADYEEWVMQEARAIAQKRLEAKDVMHSPAATRGYLGTRLVGYDHEMFGCLFLDNRHQALAFEVLFRGTIDGCAVHPRVVAKRALLLNAAAVIAVHNHPSGVPEPSAADVAITRRLNEALALMDVRLLDHFIVGGAEVVSLAERGLL